MTKAKSNKKSTSITYIIELITSFIAVIVGVLGNLLTVGIKEGKTSYIFIIISVVIVLSLFTVVISKYKKGPSKLAVIKMKVLDSYLNALEKSPLNPSFIKGEPSDN